MNQQYLALTFAVLNLLLVLSGLLLVYFDWSAARRREFLYLHFTEEKPGANYFTAARVKRTQYTRLVVSFMLLVMLQFMTVVIHARLLDTQQWLHYVQWFSRQGQDISLELARPITWIMWLEIFAFGSLGLAFIHRSGDDERLLGAPMWLFTFLTTVLWVVVLVVALVFQADAGAIFMRQAGQIAHLLVGFLLCALMWVRCRQASDVGALKYDPIAVGVAFVFWAVSPLALQLTDNYLSIPVGRMIAFLILVLIVAHAVVTEYEAVEESRHRLGRERQVILRFLKSIGEAFTTTVDVDKVLHIILDSALESTEAQAGVIFLVDERTNLLTPRIIRNFFPPLYQDMPVGLTPERTEILEAAMRDQSFRMGEGIIGEVALSGHGRLVDDVRQSCIMLGTTTEFMRNRSMLVVPLRIRDEPLGVMAVVNKQRGSFTKEDQSLLQALADQSALFVNDAMLTVEVGKQERLRRELQIARDIQQRLLPEEFPQIDGFTLDADCTSATEVGGDYYDFFWVDDDHLGMLIADVSGKGVHAALIVAMVRSAFRTQARGNPDVRDVLSLVNDFLGRDLRSDMFITCTYGILELSSRTFSWARAGHEPLIVVRETDGVEVLTPCGYALGVVGTSAFSESLEVQKMQLYSGDRLLMFTDGLTEAMNASGEEFGMERILGVLQRLELPGLSKAASPEATNGQEKDLQNLTHAVRQHVQGAPQHDDLTMLSLAVH